MAVIQCEDSKCNVIGLPQAWKWNINYSRFIRRLGANTTATTSGANTFAIQYGGPQQPVMSIIQLSIDLDCQRSKITVVFKHEFMVIKHFSKREQGWNVCHVCRMCQGEAGSFPKSLDAMLQARVTRASPLPAFQTSSTYRIRLSVKRNSVNHRLS